MNTIHAERPVKCNRCNKEWIVKTQLPNQSMLVNDNPDMGMATMVATSFKCVCLNEIWVEGQITAYRSKYAKEAI